jgi:hypothetical protein
MAEVTIRDKVWQQFTALARRLRRRPQALAESVLCEYVQRVMDEELDAASHRDARRSAVHEEDVEDLIRQYRREKTKKAVHGRPQETNAGGP